MILLHTTKYGDSSLILHGYTRDEGRVSYIVKGVGKKGKSNTSVLHPLSVLDIELVNRHTPSMSNSMQQLKDYYPKYPLHSIRSNLIKNSIAIYISELLFRSMNDFSKDVYLYDFIESSIVTLNELVVGTSNFPIWFTLKYISRLGFLPKEISQDVNKFITQTMEEALIIPLSREKRGEILDRLVSFLEVSLDRKIEIKSIKILHEILS